MEVAAVIQGSSRFSRWALMMVSLLISFFFYIPCNFSVRILGDEVAWLGVE